MDDQIHCPKCGSTQVTANKKGFSGSKAAAGVLLTGGVGLLAGTIGSNKILITCLNCAHQFKPGENKKTVVANPKLIWDEQLKEYVINPKFENETILMPLWKVLVVLLLIIVSIAFIIYLI